MVSQNSRKTTRESEMKKFITHKTLRRYKAFLDSGTGGQSRV